MIRSSFALPNHAGEVIHGDLRHRQDARQAPVVVILHGFKGFKDWGFFPEISLRLAESGYATVCFNFSRNGIGADPRKFTELDKFAENTISHELADASRVIEAIKNGDIGGKTIDRERIGVLGHSRGGGIAILLAEKFADDIQCLVTWASVASFFRFNEEHIKQWQEQGYIEVENVRTGQMMRMNKTFWDDLQQHKEEYDLLRAVANVEAPSLFIHGNEDTSIPHEESEKLYEASGAMSKRLEIIEGANHTFGIQHPMEQPSHHFEIVADLTENWLDSYLQI
ncbi:MAG: alpha/beta fold hydrolase [candidate division KSB1 bacterium]|nr:alpha/beta fold hydrolase [candidate division KSB1 bacterium]